MDLTWQSFCPTKSCHELNQNGQQNLSVWTFFRFKVRSFNFNRSKCLTPFPSYIEVWENTGDLSDPNYQGTIMKNPDGFQFDVFFVGEIIRIKSDQCK